MRRLYYGWVIVLACNLIACVTWGVAIFNQGIFVAYYVQAFGWSLPALSIAPALFHLTAGGAGVLVGRIVDKHGARPALLDGAVFLTAALLGLAPIIIARDVLFYDLALVIAGGLLIGTMLTLIVIPCLYGIVFGIGANKRRDQQVAA